MCLEDRVLVYGDCAINPNPNAEQLAEIAISSADTATAFGIEPKVALLSYSSGTSGKFYCWFAENAQFPSCRTSFGSHLS